MLLSLLLSFLSLSSAQTSSPSLSINSTTLSGSLTSSAQFPTLSGYSACVTNCLQVGIARVNCTTIVDVNCYCLKEAFPREVFACIQSDCPAELITEEKLAQQFCNLASSSPTLSFPPAPSTISFSSFSSPAPISSSPAPQSTPSPTATASSCPTILHSASTVLLAAFTYSLLHLVA